MRHQLTLATYSYVHRSTTQHLRSRLQNHTIRPPWEFIAAGQDVHGLNATNGDRASIVLTAAHGVRKIGNATTGNVGTLPTDHAVDDKARQPPATPASQQAGTDSSPGGASVARLLASLVEKRRRTRDERTVAGQERASSLARNNRKDPPGASRQGSSGRRACLSQGSPGSKSVVDIDTVRPPIYINNAFV